MSSSKNRGRFSRPQVEDYEKSRYRGLDQRLVDRRERRKVRRCLLRILGRGAAGAGGHAAPPETGTARPGCGNLERRGAVVLDAPCGYGRMFEVAAAAAGPEGVLVCADLSEAMIARTMARARASSEAGAAGTRRKTRDAAKGDRTGESGAADEHGSKAEPKVSAAEVGKNWGPAPEKNAARALGVAGDIVAGIPLKDAAADVVLCLRLFHHLHREEDRRAALKEIARVARLGAVVSFYRKNRLHELHRKIRARWKGSRYGVCMIPGPTFEAEAGAAGFRIVRIVPLFRGIHAQCLAVLEKSGCGSRMRSRSGSRSNGEKKNGV